MTVAISLERYLGVCHPHLQFSRGALLFILPVVLISVAFTVPKFMEKFNTGYGTLVTELQHFNKTYKYGYNVWAEVIFKTIIPLVSLLFLNGSIIATIKGTIHPQRTQARREEKSTKILFCVVLVFLFAHLPRVALKFLYLLDQDHENSWYWVRPVSRLALTINSSVNFVIYAMVGRNFRTELVRVFRYKKDSALKSRQIGTRQELPIKTFSTWL